MKSLLFALITLVFLSCGESKEDRELNQAKKLIEKTNRQRKSDSMEADNKMKLETAKHRLGKGDTLTDAERLKKAEEAFK